MTFEEWWNGLEHYGLRSERACEELCHGCSVKDLREWLEEAYYQGQQAEKEVGDAHSV